MNHLQPAPASGEATNDGKKLHRLHPSLPSSAFPPSQSILYPRRKKKFDVFTPGSSLESSLCLRATTWLPTPSGSRPFPKFINIRASTTNLSALIIPRVVLPVPSNHIFSHYYYSHHMFPHLRPKPRQTGFSTRSSHFLTLSSQPHPIIPPQYLQNP